MTTAVHTPVDMNTLATAIEHRMAALRELPITPIPLVDGLPPLPASALDSPALLKELERYVDEGFDASRQCEPYHPTGAYVRFDTVPFEPSSTLHIDDSGLVRVAYKHLTELQTNAVTQAEYALHCYSKRVYADPHPQQSAEDYTQQFLQAAQALLTLGGEDGAYRNTFPWRYYLIGEDFLPGWTSAMAQGEVLSVYARAYALTNDETYRVAGDKALSYMLTPIEHGGTTSTLKDFAPSVPELANQLFLEEYVAKPFPYTLNGYLSALIGLYDWAMVTDNTTAQNAFVEGCRSLQLVLPYFDFGGLTAYDLGYLTYGAAPKFSAHYHKVHVFLLHAIHSMVPQFGFNRTEQAWAAYPHLYKAQRLPKPKKRWWRLHLSQFRPLVGLPPKP
jgi:hypothetical protein